MTPAKIKALHAAFAAARVTRQQPAFDPVARMPGVIDQLVGMDAALFERALNEAGFEIRERGVDDDGRC